MLCLNYYILYIDAYVRIRSLKWLVSVCFAVGITVRLLTQCVLLLMVQVAGEVADRSGQIKAGDKLLSINMEDISQANQDTVRNLLQVCARMHMLCVNAKASEA